MIDKLATILSDYPYLTVNKLVVAIQSSFFLALFLLLFIYFYYRYFWKYQEARQLFWIFSIIFSVAVIAKFTIGIFFQGYIFDRLILFAVPSPKAIGIMWFLGVIAAFALFLWLRERIENLPRAKFLLTLYILFVVLSVGVAGIREGFFSIYEPFSRTTWEYTGNLHLVEGVQDFLSRYVELQPQLALHAITHPPGYTIILYLFQKYLYANLIMLSVLVVMVGGLTIIPLYYFLKNFLSEYSVRRGLEIFILIPSVVMMSATSMEAVFLFSTWVTIAMVYYGWSRSFLYSFLGGIAAGISIFMNFIFLLLFPLFLMFFSILFFNQYTPRVSWIGKLIPRVGHEISKEWFWWRIVVSAAGFLAFFAFLYFWSGYSIVENFFAARGANQEAVRSNFESLGMYLTYFVMNFVALGVYLGIPNVIILVRNIKRFFTEKKEALMPFIMLAFFLLIGVFQGEVGRLWLYWLPLFVIPLGYSVQKYRESQFTAVLSLLFFQIIILQVLFYTYW